MLCSGIESLTALTPLPFNRQGSRGLCGQICADGAHHGYA